MTETKLRSRGRYHVRVELRRGALDDPSFAIDARAALSNALGREIPRGIEVKLVEQPSRAVYLIPL